MTRTFVILGGISAFLAVLLGAFGAHGLRSHLSAESMSIYQTGVQYQMTHALGLLLIGLLLERRTQNVKLIRAGWLLVAGSVIFSGSLYGLALSGVRILGAITPLGGLCFLAGWILLVWAMATEKQE